MTTLASSGDVTRAFEPKKLVVDISNTSKESRKAVTAAVEAHPHMTATKKSISAHVLWIDRALPIQRFYLQRMAGNRRVFQRTNRFFGMDDRFGKSSLTCSLRMSNELLCKEPTLHAKKFCQGIVAPFLPRTFCVPDEEQQVAAYTASTESILTKTHEAPWYIVKPSLGRCGRGMYLANSLESALTGWKEEKLMDYGEEDAVKPVSAAYAGKDGKEVTKGPYPSIIQQYISRPMLFGASRRKFDIRLYVVVTDTTPLRAFLYKEGLVRCCCMDYEQPSPANAHLLHVHLTNSKINPSTTGAVAKGHKQTLNKRLLSDWLYTLEDTENVQQGKGGHLTRESFWSQAHGIISNTLQAIQPATAFFYDTCFARTERERNDTSRSFQTLGFDVMSDEAGKLWLLEVNANPSLNLDTPVDENIKLPLLNGVFNMLSHGAHDGFLKVPTSADLFEPITFDEGQDDLLNELRFIYTKFCGWIEGNPKPAKDGPMSASKKGELLKAMQSVYAMQSTLIEPTPALDEKVSDCSMLEDFICLFTHVRNDIVLQCAKVGGLKGPEAIFTREVEKQLLSSMI